MSDGTPAGGDASGKKPREEFEAARRALVDKYVAEIPGAKPSDFDGVEIAQFAATAVKVRTDRQTEEDAIVARRLGVKVEDVQAAVDKFKAPNVVDDDDGDDEQVETAADRIASLGALGARPARPDLEDTSGLWGVDLIASEFRKNPPGKS